MSNKQDEALESILASAQKAKKKDWRVFETYKHYIEALNLSYKPQERALRKLIDILKV